MERERGRQAGLGQGGGGARKGKKMSKDTIKVGRVRGGQEEGSEGRGRAEKEFI